MGAPATAGRWIINAVALAVVVLLVTTFLINHDEEATRVAHAEYVDQAAEAFPKLRSNMFVGEGVQYAERSDRRAWLPALRRVITESRPYKIANVHEWVVWSFSGVFVLVSLLLWFGHRNKRLEMQRDAHMSSAAAAMVAAAMQTGHAPQSRPALPDASGTRCLPDARCLSDTPRVEELVTAQ